MERTHAGWLVTGAQRDTISLTSFRIRLLIQKGIAQILRDKIEMRKNEMQSGTHKLDWRQQKNPPEITPVVVTDVLSSDWMSSKIVDTTT